MGTLANSEDLDEMLHDAAFHQGLHCLLRQKTLHCLLRQTQSSEKEIFFF